MSQPLPIREFTEATLNDLRSLVDVNTIVGEPITANGMVIIPVSKVHFGYGVGGSDLPVEKAPMFGGATAGGVTIQPLAFLVVRDNDVTLLPVPTADNTSDRIVNAVPGVVDKILGMIPKKDTGDAAQPEPGKQ